MNASQLCVVTAISDDLKDLSVLIRETFDVQAVVLDAFRTNPGLGYPGGRRDVLFSIPQEDVPRFAVPRLEYGIRWWSDYLADSRCLVPKEILRKYEGRQ